MANAMTEHSKKLRAKTAAEWTKKRIAEGKIKVISLQLEPALLAEFDAMAKAKGLSRRAAFEEIWAFWKENANKD